MKRFLVVALVLIVSTQLFAGGQGEAAKPGPVTLTVWGRDLPDDDPTHQYHKAVAEMFPAKYGDTITLEYVPNVEVGNTVRVALAANEGPDIFQSWGGSTMGGYADAGKLLDLTSELADVPTSEAAKNAMSWKGKTYGVAPFFAVAGLFVNEGIFKQHNLKVPTTIAEMERTADYLLGKGIQPFALGGKDKWPILAMYMYLTNRYGGYAFSKAQAREIRFDNDAFVNAGLIYQKWGNKGYFGSKPLSESYGDAQALMNTGKAAMQVTGSWMCSGYSDPATTDQTIGFYPFPIVQGGAGKATDVMGQTDIGWAATIFGKDRKAAVVEFMKYVMSPEVVSKDPGRVCSVPGVAAPTRLTKMASDVLANAQRVTFWWDQDLPPDITAPLQDTLQAFFIPDASVKDWLTKYEALAAESLGPVK